MSIILLLFVVWVGFSGYRGYSRGLWNGVFSIVGLLAAYLACFFWAPALSELFLGWGWGFLAAYSTAFLAVYGVTYLCTAELPRKLLASALATSPAHRWLGAGLGSVVGVASGLVFIWAFSLLQGAVALHSTDEVQANSAAPVTAEPVVEVANAMMAGVARAGADLAGVSPLQAEVISGFTREPTKTIQNLQALGKSQALRSFLQDTQVREYLQADNMDGLIESPAFQRVITLPELGDVRQMAQQEVARMGQEASIRNGDFYLASQFSQAWQQLALMQDDPRLKQVINDPAVKAMIEKRDIPGLLANAKVQSLMAIVMRGDLVTPAPSSLHTPSAQPAHNETQVQPKVPSRVYKWRDEQGQIQYSDSPPEDETQLVE